MNKNKMKLRHLDMQAEVREKFFKKPCNEIRFRASNG